MQNTSNTDINML